MCRTRRTTRRRVSKIKMSKRVACIILLLHFLVNYPRVKLSKYISSTVRVEPKHKGVALTKCFSSSKVTTGSLFKYSFTKNTVVNSYNLRGSITVALLANI